MEYIIQAADGMYFLGWDPVLGQRKYTSERRLAYRMRMPIARTTLGKLSDEYPDAVIIKA